MLFLRLYLSLLEMVLHGDDDPEGAVRIRDAKEVVFSNYKKSFVFTKASLLEDEEGNTFIHLKPDRCRTLGRMLASRCPGPVRKEIQNKGPRFWTKKDQPGKRFINKMISYKKSASKTLYKHTGKRFTSRKKNERADQLTAEVITVTLPAIDEHPEIDAVFRYKKYKIVNMWVKLDGAVLNHISVMAAKFFSKYGVGEIAEDDSVSFHSDDINDTIEFRDDEQENDMNLVYQHEHRADPVPQDEHHADPVPQDEHRADPVPQDKDVVSAGPSLNVYLSPLAQAFARGSIRSCDRPVDISDSAPVN